MVSLAPVADTYRSNSMGKGSTAQNKNNQSVRIRTDPASEPGNPDHWPTRGYNLSDLNWDAKRAVIHYRHTKGPDSTSEQNPASPTNPAKAKGL